jgi:predicted nuclease of restriction endonuclease-like RecB superfamily
MRAAWRKQKHTPEQSQRSAKLGAEALWRKYRRDPRFKKELDEKLRASRSRGGAISLRNLGEAGFKRRLENTGQVLVKARFSDSLGNRHRSPGEVKVAELLIRSGIEFVVEPRVEVKEHAFYPDFSLDDGSKIIEVVGYAGDRYWNRTARKLQLLTEADSSLRVAVITTYLRIVERKLRGIPRVTIFSPYQEVELVRWCRGTPGFTNA